MSDQPGAQGQSPRFDHQPTNGPGGLNTGDKVGKEGMGGCGLMVVAILVLTALAMAPWGKMLPRGVIEGFQRGQEVGAQTRATSTPPLGPTREQIIATSRDINQVAKALAAGDGEKTSATLDRGRVSVTIDLDPLGFIWTSKSVFLNHVSAMVPKIFERFPEARVVRISGLASFRDIRGNDAKGVALWLEFSRDDAARIDWTNVLRSNLPLVATEQWATPAFR